MCLQHTNEDVVQIVAMAGGIGKGGRSELNIGRGFVEGIVDVDAHAHDHPAFRARGDFTQNTAQFFAGEHHIVGPF